VCGKSCTPQIIAATSSARKPLYVQYGDFVKGIFVGRTYGPAPGLECPAPCLGYSFRNEEVTVLIEDTLPYGQLASADSSSGWWCRSVLSPPGNAEVAVTARSWGSLIGYSFLSFFCPVADLLHPDPVGDTRVPFYVPF
jgi:peptide/nickel transport system permease protein